MSGGWDPDLCIECFHLPQMHGIQDPRLEPCTCCESPAALAAAAPDEGDDCD